MHCEPKCKTDKYFMSNWHGEMTGKTDLWIFKGCHRVFVWFSKTKMQIRQIIKC